MHNLNFYIVKKVITRLFDKDVEWKPEADESYRSKVYNSITLEGYLTSSENNWYSIGGRYSGLLNKILGEDILTDETFFRPKYNTLLQNKIAKNKEFATRYNLMSSEEKQLYDKEYITKKIGFRDSSRIYGYPDDIQFISPRLLQGLSKFFLEIVDNHEGPVIWSQGEGKISPEKLFENASYLGFSLAVLDLHT